MHVCQVPVCWMSIISVKIKQVQISTKQNAEIWNIHILWKQELQYTCRNYCFLLPQTANLKLKQTVFFCKVYCCTTTNTNNQETTWTFLIASSLLCIKCHQELKKIVSGQDYNRQTQTFGSMHADSATEESNSIKTSSSSAPVWTRLQQTNTDIWVYASRLNNRRNQ